MRTRLIAIPLALLLSLPVAASTGVIENDEKEAQDAVVAVSTVATASPRVAGLDGTNWKLDVEPDGMTRRKGEKQFEETLTFAEGNVSLSEARVGFETSKYTAAKSGEKAWTFTAKRANAADGYSQWTGFVKGNALDGTMIWTRIDGTVLTYFLKGSKLE